MGDVEDRRYWILSVHSKIRETGRPLDRRNIMGTADLCAHDQLLITHESDVAYIPRSPASFFSDFYRIIRNEGGRRCSSSHRIERRITAPLQDRLAMRRHSRFTGCT